MKLTIWSLLLPIPMTIVISAHLVFASTIEATGSKNSKKLDKSIPPGQVHEECMALTPQKKLMYSFHSKAPLNFNIHYHTEKNVYYPVKLDNASVFQDEFQPTSKHDYCLMWSNTSKVQVRLTGSFWLE